MTPYKLEDGKLVRDDSGALSASSSKRVLFSALCLQVDRASRLEAELAAARTAAGIEAGMPLDEWLKAEIEDHADMIRKRDEWKAIYELTLNTAREIMDERDEARRENAMHVMRINGVVRWINGGNDAWLHIMNDDADCSYCLGEWPCNSELTRRALLGESDAEMIAADVPSDKIEIEYKP